MLSPDRKDEFIKNLEEKQPLGGEEMPIDAWKELQKVVRHSLLSGSHPQTLMTQHMPPTATCLHWHPFTFTAV